MRLPAPLTPCCGGLGADRGEKFGPWGTVPHAEHGQMGGREDVNGLLALTRIEKLPNDQHFAVAQAIGRRLRSMAVGAGAGSSVLKSSATSGCRQGIKPEPKVPVLRACAPVADVRQGCLVLFSHLAIIVSAFPYGMHSCVVPPGRR